jgi:sterol desaturase/sphingolipid hydroxylase (fatty acid hydroxylase superfamily)
MAGAASGGGTAVVGALVTSWVGVLTVAAVAAWLGVVGLRVLLGAGNLTGALAAARGETVGPALLATVLVLFVAERRWPAVDRPALSRAHLVDAGYLALFAVAVLPLLTLVQTGFAVELQRYALFLRLGRLPLVPQVAVVAVVLVGMDGMNWLAHLANHRSTSLWRLHALHHSQEDMSVFTTFRTHPLVHASYLPAMVPALFLGASGNVPVAALITYGCLVTLPHANLRWSFGPLGKVVVSPAYHRLHHARELTDARRAVNLGFVLVGWDQLARRAAYPTRGVAIATGIAGRPVPVEQAAPRRIVRVVVAQLAQPFRLRAATGGPS